ncbi:MAG: glycosyltransferase family 4 protein [Chlamydiales bacterium]|nr:glycosyltransferase family 4 protein [Chlamydiales bacterium]
MKILHTESSSGWGGQEIRILKESLGMRTRGHTCFFAIAKGGGLVAKAAAEGFSVTELSFKRPQAFKVIWQLVNLIRKEGIDLVVTHSSLDAWLGGIAARLTRTPVMRMRHLSTPIRSGLNSHLLYRGLADFVVTTSELAAKMIIAQAKRTPSTCISVPTGVETEVLAVKPEEAREFRKKIGVLSEECLVGSVCFVRSWKGIGDFLRAAALLKEEKWIKWVVVGGGYVDQYKPLAKELGVEGSVIFTGHLESPFAAMAALDIFALLSTAHEGVSQASLQAAYLQKPLITTPTGGLPEVCIHGETGIIVPPFSAEQVAEAVKKLASDASLRKRFGQNAHSLVQEKFTLPSTLSQMESIYLSLSRA